MRELAEREAAAAQAHREQEESARREQDAAEAAKLAEAEAATAAAREEHERRLKEDPLSRETWERGQARNRAAENIRRAAEMAKTDRKRVGKGKSVSERVNLGGR